MRSRHQRVGAWVGVWTTAVSLCVLVPDVAAGPRPQGPRRSERHPATVRLLDVPFIAQSEALCGGAAVAMLARYWGRRDVYVEDFAGLVDPQARGITTKALTEATSRLGWRAIPFRGTERSVRGHLARGRPLIVLVRESPDRYHCPPWHAVCKNRVSPFNNKH